MTTETKNNTPKKLLSPQEVADILGIRSDTLSVWRCCRPDKLTWVKVGRKVMYRSEDIHEFIEQNTITKSV